MIARRCANCKGPLHPVTLTHLMNTGCTAPVEDEPLSLDEVLAVVQAERGRR